MSIAERIRPYFSDFLKQRGKTQQPLFEFEELNDPKGLYIDTMKPMHGARDPLSFRSKGALGMCYAAASADRGAVVKMPGRRR